MGKTAGIILYMFFLLVMGTETTDAFLASLLLLSIIEGVILIKRILTKNLA